MSGILSPDISEDQQRIRTRNYLFFEFVFAGSITLLTFLIWVPGHTMQSIMYIMERKERKKNRENYLNQQAALQKKLID